MIEEKYYEGIPVRMDGRIWEAQVAKRARRHWGLAYRISKHIGPSTKYKVLWNNGQLTQENDYVLVVNKEILKLQRALDRERSLKQIRERNKRC